MSMQQIGYVILGVLLVCTASVYGCPSGERMATPDELFDSALKASSNNEREEAAVQLAAFGFDERVRVRQLLEQSQDEAVQVACIRGLGAMYDYDSMENLLDLLDDPSLKIRTRANIAVSRLLGRDHGFKAKASDQQRQDVVKKMRADWAGMKDSELLVNFKRELEEKRKQESQL